MSFEPLTWGRTDAEAVAQRRATPLDPVGAWRDWPTSDKELFVREAGALLVALGFAAEDDLVAALDG